jgi:hypothetical protein
MNETGQAFHCRTCANLRSEQGRTFCEWHESFLERSALSGDCEGYVCKESSARKGKSDNNAGQATQDLKVTWPKTGSTSALQPEQAMILTALELKQLKGSIVLEKVRCGKRNCRCSRGHFHQAFYLHFYQSGKVRRKYLSKSMVGLLRCSREELERLLSEVESASERVLGQESRPSESSGVV